MQRSYPFPFGGFLFTPQLPTSSLWSCSFCSLWSCSTRIAIHHRSYTFCFALLLYLPSRSQGQGTFTTKASLAQLLHVLFNRLRDAHCHWNQWTFAISHTALCRPMDDIILCRGWQCSGAQNRQSFRKSRLPNPSVAALKVMHLTFVVNWAKWTAWQCTLPSSDQRKGQINIKSGVWKLRKKRWGKM